MSHTPLVRWARHEVPIWGWIALVAAMALILRLHGLGDKPLWNDEAWSVTISGESAAHAIAAVRNDYHPPLYYLTLNIWQHFGTGDFWVRLPSAAFGTCGAVLVFLAGMRLAGPVLGLAAGSIFATMPLQVEWSQVARGYAELYCAVALALLGFFRIVCRERTETVPAWAWLGYVAGSAMALWIHNLAVFFVFVANLAAFVEWILAWHRDRPFAMRWVAAQLIVVLLYLPWVPSLMLQIGHLAAAKHFFALSWGIYRDDIETVYGIARLWTLAPASLVATVALAAIGLTAGPIPSNAKRALAIISFSLPVLAALMFAADHAFFGVLVGKIVWLGVPYSLAVGAGVVTTAAWLQRRQWVRGGGGFVLIVGFTVMQTQGLRNLYASPNPAWDRAAELTRAAMLPGDAIMDDPNEPAHAYNYYLSHAGASLPHVYPDKEQSSIIPWVGQYRRLWVPVPSPPHENRLMEAVAAARGANLTVSKISLQSLNLYLISGANRNDRTQ